MSDPVTLEKVLYTANATARGGREGSVRTDDGTLDLAVTMPKGLGGSGAAGTNPEQLFAAGYAACFASALGAVARMQKVTLSAPPEVQAEVSIGSIGGGRFGLSAKLVATVPGVAPAVAKALVEAAHSVCPYSNATRGNIVVEVSAAS